MTLTMQEIAQDLIAFACGNGTREKRTGTAFWAEINGTPKLLTAGHVPWKQLECDPPKPAPINETLDVQWWKADCISGSGSATFTAHTHDQTLDYAVIEFQDGSPPPPEQCFSIDVNSPVEGESIGAFGFSLDLDPDPGADHLNFKKAIGVVEAVYSNSYAQILAGGTAISGLSGGPAFKYWDENSIDDQVLGFVQGKPTDEILTRYGIADGYVLFAASSFV